jgi:hypothetical protein
MNEFVEDDKGKRWYSWIKREMNKVFQEEINLSKTDLTSDNNMINRLEDY